MDGVFGKAVEWEEDNYKSRLEEKYASVYNINHCSSLGDEQPIVDDPNMFKEDESVCTNKKQFPPDVDGGSSSVSMLQPIVVTEDGSVFPAKQSEIILGNDGTMHVNKEGTVYEIENILDYDSWNAIFSSQEPHQLISTVGQEFKQYTTQDKNYVPANEDKGNGYYHPSERQRFSEVESVSTLDYSTAVVNGPILQDSKQTSGSVLSLGEGSLQDSPHSTPDPKIAHQCNVCGKSFDYLSALSMHMRTHTGEKPFQCKECGKCFAQNGNLIRHKRIHTGEMHYQCTLCGKSFANADTLSRHRRTHTGERPYQCKVCSASFSERGTLTKHILIHTGEKPYQCKVCSTSFSDRSTLRQHNLLHTGEKPHQCNTCRKCFTGASDLTVHKRTHTHEKPYQCKVCGKLFGNHSSFSRHKLIHTGENPFQCQTCGTSFRTSSNLSRHKLIHSNTKPHKYQQCGKSVRHNLNL